MSDCVKGGWIVIFLWGENIVMFRDLTIVLGAKKLGNTIVLGAKKLGNQYSPNK